jgi:hypothetical protein
MPTNRNAVIYPPAGHRPAAATWNWPNRRISAEELPTIASNAPGSTTHTFFVSSQNARRSEETVKATVFPSPGSFQKTYFKANCICRAGIDVLVTLPPAAVSIWVFGLFGVFGVFGALK